MNMWCRVLIILSLVVLNGVHSRRNERKCRKYKDTSCIKINDCYEAIQAITEDRQHELVNCGWDSVDLTIEYLCCKDGLGLRGPLPVTRTTTVEPPPSSGIADRMCNQFTSSLTPGATLDRVIGGTRVLEGEFPHMVALGAQDYTSGTMNWGFCGGTLISERFVLTAAHCVSKGTLPVTKVKVGLINLKAENDDGKTEELDVKKIIYYPTLPKYRQQHDIALVELKQNVTFSEYRRPACLYTKDTLPENITVAGWGATSKDSKETSQVLLKADLRAIHKDECLKHHSNIKNVHYMCALDDEGLKDTCQGDSGGPLQIIYNPITLTYSIIGVTSNGIGCGGINNPGIYTLVSKYAHWIETIVWP